MRKIETALEVALIVMRNGGSTKKGGPGFSGTDLQVQDFNRPTPESLSRLRSIIDEAFGRKG